VGGVAGSTDVAVNTPAPVSDAAENRAVGVVLEPVDGVRLPWLEEPQDIRRDLRASVLQGADWRTGFSDEVCIGVWLWERWRPTLEGRGMHREEFLDVVVDFGRELWLWLMGDRIWDQYLPALAGRVARRLPPQPDIAAS
jgi:hypothetical protein